MLLGLIGISFIGMNIFIKPIVLFVFVFPPSISWSNELIDMAINGPRYFKITTVLDCRRVSSILDDWLTVLVLDLTNEKAIVKNQLISVRPWSIFEYSIRGNTERDSEEVYDIDDSEGHKILFNFQDGDWVLWMNTLRLESAESELEFYCRHL